MILKNHLLSSSLQPQQPRIHRYYYMTKRKPRSQQPLGLFPETCIEPNISQHLPKEFRQNSCKILRTRSHHWRLPQTLRRDKTIQKLCLQIKNKENSLDSSANDRQKNQQKIKGISDFHPKINKIKLKFLRNENQSHTINRYQNILKSRVDYRQVLEKAKSSIKLNFSCQRIAPLNKNLISLESQKILDFQAESSEQMPKKHRYEEISPEEFIYEKHSSALRKGLVQKISQMMRKTSQKIYKEDMTIQ